MEKEGIAVLLMLADQERAEDIADALVEEPGATARLRPDPEAPEPDVRVLDADLSEAEAGGPLVLLSDDPAAAEGKPHVRAVLPKDAPADLVAAAARLAAAGYEVRKSVEGKTLGEHGFEPETPLTAREMQVLGLLADGASNKVIARALDISVHTAKFHVASVTGKLHARNRTDAISIALREGVLMA